jgi:hypothetical protein
MEIEIEDYKIHIREILEEKIVLNGYIDYDKEYNFCRNIISSIITNSKIKTINVLEIQGNILQIIYDEVLKNKTLKCSETNFESFEDLFGTQWRHLKIHFYQIYFSKYVSLRDVKKFFFELSKLIDRRVTIYVDDINLDKAMLFFEYYDYVDIKLSDKRKFSEMILCDKYNLNGKENIKQFILDIEKIILLLSSVLHYCFISLIFRFY